MHLLLMLWFFCFTATCQSSSVLQTTGQQYHQMNYLPSQSLLAQYNLNSKQLCVALCARLSSTCNIAVFNPVGTPPCLLYGEPLTMTNLFPSKNTVVIGFGQNNSNRVSGCLSSGGITALSSYNLITMGDLSIVNGVENRTIICGSLVSTTSTDFAKALNSGTYPPATYTLEINGQVASGNSFQVFAGSFALSTNTTHTYSTINNISYTLDGRGVLIEEGNDGGKIVIDANLTSKCDTIVNDIITLSNELLNIANISGNNISIPTSVDGPLTFNVNKLDVNGMAVFNIDGNIALNNPLVQIIEVNVDASVTNAVQLVVINLSGISISFSQGNMAGTWLSSATPGQSQTIWNFYQATSISLSRGWMGALLAPYASVTTNTNIAGATAVQTLTTGAEVDNPPITMPSCI